MTYLIINEQHSLFPEQESLLRDFCPKGYETITVPKEGWNRDEMDFWIKNLRGNEVVFASPIPYMLAKLAYINGYDNGADIARGGTGSDWVVLVFHNDRREKKELPGGKVIQVVSSTGWELL